MTKSAKIETAIKRTFSRLHSAEDRLRSQGEVMLNLTGLEPTACDSVESMIDGSKKKLTKTSAAKVRSAWKLYKREGRKIINLHFQLKELADKAEMRKKDDRPSSS